MTLDVRDGQSSLIPAPGAAGRRGERDAAMVRRALDLATEGLATARPNPIVGAVVVAGDRVVGEGYHRRCGEPHAEMNALAVAGARAAGATLYVSLEPCAHTGRTPPCVEGLGAAGLARVVVPALDPDARVFGRGVRALRAAGVEVTLGCLEAEAVLHNLAYYRERLGWSRTVTLKLAVSADGKLAREPGRRDRVTGDQADRLVHRLRAAHDCVVVGAETARVDRPLLDCRRLDAEERGADPVPVVLDSQLRLPGDNRWSVLGRPYVVLCTGAASGERVRALERAGARVVRCEAEQGGVSIAAALDALEAMGLRRVLVEGGAAVFGSFLRSELWDAFYRFQSRERFGARGVSVAGDGANAPEGAVRIDAGALGEDELVRFVRASTLTAIVSRLRAAGGEA
ncbi:MAG: bifunctional diaminohydroxyphosphoribosylaminopyrimidine deaminase/5-amino-6-(5-phosphoribosylamino)uracil reductase RibD [Candidatus Krumholzibacteria bacterium]|nr:bifunctional diaminohydroxyphosphoribosylaminopyrimidine deaminase/5-amino-6-(5-phosphoribosylamino)uracil reductase RibD [Candidatus Krumholzibacteria bacterium]